MHLEIIYIPRRSIVYTIHIYGERDTDIVEDLCIIYRHQLGNFLHIYSNIYIDK